MSKNIHRVKFLLPVSFNLGTLSGKKKDLKKLLLYEKVFSHPGHLEVEAVKSGNCPNFTTCTSNFYDDRRFTS